MGAVALYRAGGAIAETATQLKRTLTQVEVISDRVEVLTRGFKGGETSIADLLASVGHLAQSLERNMKIVNVVSAIIASIGTAIAAFVSTRPPVDEAGQAHPPDIATVTGEKPSPSPSTVSSEASMDTEQRSAAFSTSGDKTFGHD